MTSINLHRPRVCSQLPTAYPICLLSIFIGASLLKFILFEIIT